MAWTTPRTWVAGELVTAALFNSHIRDNENAIKDGLSGTGFTLVDLLGAAAPAVSAAGHLKLIYNTTTGALEASINAAAFSAVGNPPNYTSALLLNDMLH